MSIIHGAFGIGCEIIGHAAWVTGNVLQAGADAAYTVGAGALSTAEDNYLKAGIERQPWLEKRMLLYQELLAQAQSEHQH